MLKASSPPAGRRERRRLQKVPTPGALVLDRGFDGRRDPQGCDLVALAPDDLEPVAVEDEGLAHARDGLGLVDHKAGHRHGVLCPRERRQKRRGDEEEEGAGTHAADTTTWFEPLFFPPRPLQTTAAAKKGPLS